MTPFLLIPGLNCDARVFRHATDALWRFGPVMVANHQRGDGMAGIARAILDDAPPRFALAGFSMGGYLAFEILRQSPERVTKLALLDTSARLNTEESIENRRRRMALAKGGKFGLVVEQSFPGSVHLDNAGNSDLYSIHRAMADANGAEIYQRHLQAIMTRPDSRPGLATIKLPTLIVVGEGDQTTPPELSREMQEGIAGSRLMVIPRAGHLALLEQPQLVNAALSEWASA